MNIIITKSHDESCQIASKMIIQIIKDNTAPMLGLATGGSVEGIYAALVHAYHNKEVDFRHVHTINLDEYIGLSPEHDQSYNYFMHKQLFDHVNIDPKNTYVPNGANPVSQELHKFHTLLASSPRDLQLLGVGPNGHIAFNEPHTELHANAFEVKIAESTIKANARYFNNENEVPKTAFTQGMGDILKAKSLLLIATGINKTDAIKKLILDDHITTQSPCTLLKTHPNVTIIIDQELADHVGYIK